MDLDDTLPVVEDGTFLAIGVVIQWLQHQWLRQLQTYPCVICDSVCRASLRLLVRNRNLPRVSKPKKAAITAY